MKYRKKKSLFKIMPNFLWISTLKSINPKKKKSYIYIEREILSPAYLFDLHDNKY